MYYILNYGLCLSDCYNIYTCFVIRLWCKLNDLLGKPNIILPDHSDSNKLAEEFRTYFSDKVANIRKKIEQDLKEIDATADDDISLLESPDDLIRSQQEENASCLREFRCISEEDSRQSRACPISSAP